MPPYLISRTHTHHHLGRRHNSTAPTAAPTTHRDHSASENADATPLHGMNALACVCILVLDRLPQFIVIVKDRGCRYVPTAPPATHAPRHQGRDAGSEHDDPLFQVLLLAPLLVPIVPIGRQGMNAGHTRACL